MPIRHKQIWHCRAQLPNISGYIRNSYKWSKACYFTNIKFAVPLQKDAGKEPPEYARQLVDKLAIVYAQVREYLRGAQICQKLYHDINTPLWKFEVGNLVYRRKDSWKAGLSPKLCPLYTGPVLVTQMLYPSLYRVEDLKHAWVLHHDKLKLCNDCRVPHGIRRKRHEVLRDVTGSEGDTERTFRGTDYWSFTVGPDEWWGWDGSFNCWPPCIAAACVSGWYCFCRLGSRRGRIRQHWAALGNIWRWRGIWWSSKHDCWLLSQHGWGQWWCAGLFGVGKCCPGWNDPG